MVSLFPLLDSLRHTEHAYYSDFRKKFTASPAPVRHDVPRLTPSGRANGRAPATPRASNQECLQLPPGFSGPGLALTGLHRILPGRVLGNAIPRAVAVQLPVFVPSETLRRLDRAAERALSVSAKERVARVVRLAPESRRKANAVELHVGRLDVGEFRQCRQHVGKADQITARSACGNRARHAGNEGHMHRGRRR